MHSGPQQFGEVAVVCPGIAVAGQFHHGGGDHLGDGVVVSSAPVPVGQWGGAMLAESGEKALGVTFTHSHDLYSPGGGKVVFQDTVEHLDPGLFLLIQLYIPYRDGIFADQLAGDRIVDHQQRIPGRVVSPFVSESSHAAMVRAKARIRDMDMTQARLRTVNFKHVNQIACD